METTTRPHLFELLDEAFAPKTLESRLKKEWLLFSHGYCSCQECKPGLRPLQVRGLVMNGD
jgi:hypothetical protein